MNTTAFIKAICLSILSLSATNALAEKSKKDKPKTREVNIVREASYGKDKTNVDFESASLYGARKTPMNTSITQSKSDKSFDLIKIREHWNPEMVQSTSSLELGR